MPGLPLVRRRTSHFLALCLALCAWTEPTWANGRYPAAGQIVQSPSNPSHLLARATFGLLQSQDGGATWQWLCESVLGFSGQYDPFVGITQADTIVAATDVGIALSSVNACAWNHVQEPDSATHLPAIDLVIDPNQTSHVVVLAQTPDHKRVRLLESLDSGLTWHALGVPLPETLVGLTVEIAPSKPQRFYVSGRANPDETDHVVARTDDAGAHWVLLPFNPTMLDDAGVPLPAAQTQVVGTYVGAVDPHDADTVWLRARRSTQPDQVWRSQDGGATWQRAFQAGKGRLFGFALSPDGKEVAIGTTMPTPGVWHANVADLKFAQVNKVGAFCLKWLPSGLFVCADDTWDGYALGVSHDAGTTFTPVHRLQDTLPLECPAGSSVATTCASEWPAAAALLGVGTAEPIAEPAACSAQTSERSGPAAFLTVLACAHLVVGLARRRFAPL